ncbi:MAG: hypothetical protein OZ921_10050 [Sorangiineae bacterium]|nr:hypothetical protein [Polyangiaceae bacterium]MEB2322847.1 hypothetical protein [Sorangiineae bacterium]
MAIGLHGFSETMRGTWTPTDGSGRRVCWFSVDADATDAAAYVKGGVMQLDGSFFAEGLAENVPVKGTLEVQLLRRRIAYRLEFTGADGKPYRYLGEKTLGLMRPLHGLTTLPAELTDAHGARIGTSLTRFDARRDLAGFLRSMRPAEPARHARKSRAS